jgi:hypothetical protein
MQKEIKIEHHEDHEPTKTLPILLTILPRMKLPRRNNLHLVTQAHIRHLAPPQSRRPPPPLRTRLADRRAILQAMRTSSSIHASRRD